MFERFSREARAVVTQARTEAQTMGHRHFGTEHLLLALAWQPGGAHDALTAAGLTRDRVAEAVASGTVLGAADADALKSIGIDLDAVLSHIGDTFGTEALQRAMPGRRGRVGVTPRVRKVLQLALREAVHMGDKSIGTEHILLGILRDGGGRAAKIISDVGVSADELRRVLLTGLGKAA